MDENKQEQMVSIIVPVYNAEAYLPEMIESVICQNYNNLELLLIDNCSMDNSFEICKSYEKKDVRIRVMQETENGPAAVRNHGLLAAHGGYIMFLDADDFLADNTVLDRFVNVMKHEEADIVVGNYERLWNGQRFAAASHTSFSEKNPDSEDFRFQGFFSVGTLSYVWGKLYRKQFLEKNEAVFENLPYAEDKLFNIQCYLCNPKYAFIQETGYIYRKNDDSISFTYRPNSLECWMAIAYRLQKLLTEKEEIKQIRCRKDENAEIECLEKKYWGFIYYLIFFAIFFDAKMEYVEHNHSILAVKKLIKMYQTDDLVKETFVQIKRKTYTEKLSQKLWKIMIRGFSIAMWVHLYWTLAFGIKLLIDLRIDEKLSDTGLRE